MMVAMSVQAAVELNLVFKGTRTVAENQAGTSREKAVAGASPFAFRMRESSDGVINQLKKRQLSKGFIAAFNVEHHGVNRVLVFVRPGRVKGKINQILDAARLRPPVKSFGIAVHAHIQGSVDVNPAEPVGEHLFYAIPIF